MGESSGQAETWQALLAAARLREWVFTSRVPVVGPLLAGGREALSRVAAKWAVRAVAQQQTSFNLALLSWLAAAEARADALEERQLAATARLLDELAAAEARLLARLDEVDAQLLENDRATVRMARHAVEAARGVAGLSAELGSLRRQVAELAGAADGVAGDRAESGPPGSREQGEA